MRKRGRLVLLKSIILYHIFFVLFSHSLYTTLLPAQPAMSRWFRHIGHHRDSIHRARVVAESKKIYCQKEKRYNSHTALRRYIPTFPYSFKKSQRDPKFFFKEVFFSHFFSLSLFFSCVLLLYLFLMTGCLLFAPFFSLIHFGRCERHLNDKSYLECRSSYATKAFCCSLAGYCIIIHSIFTCCSV